MLQAVQESRKGVIHKRCLCGKARPTFGEAGGRAVCCKQCKTSEMVDVHNKRCRCGKARRIYGDAGGKAVCCKQCKTPEMVDVHNIMVKQQARPMQLVALEE